MNDRTAVILLERIVVLLKLLVLKTPQLLVLKEFYEELGLVFVEEKHGRGPTHYAAELGPVILEFYPLPVNERLNVHERLGFQVEDFSACLKRLKLAGVSILKECQNGATILDPDGRKIDLER